MQDGTTGLQGAPLNDLEKAAVAPTQVQNRMADVEAKRVAAAAASAPAHVLPPKRRIRPRAQASSKRQVPPPPPRGAHSSFTWIRLPDSIQRPHNATIVTRHFRSGSHHVRFCCHYSIIRKSFPPAGTGFLHQTVCQERVDCAAQGRPGMCAFGPFSIIVSALSI